MSGLVVTDDDYAAMISDVRCATGPIAVDTETTGLFPYENDRLTGISVAGGAHNTRLWDWYLPVAHAPSAVKNRPAGLVIYYLSQHRDGLIMHHSLFDLAVIERYSRGDYDLVDCLVWDTQTVAWLLDENLPTGLKPTCDRVLGTDSSDEQKAVKALLRGGKTWATLTAEEIGAYGSKDSALTRDLSVWQMAALDRLAKGGLDHWPAVQREIDFITDVLYPMRRTGIAVSAARLARGRGSFMAKAEEMRAKIPCNPNSPKQVAAWLYDERGAPCHVYTKKGGRSVNAAALEELAGRDEGAKALLEYRHFSKGISGYFKPLEERRCKDGRIRPSFSASRTVTGRLACREPNLQTIPKGSKMPEVRQCFIAREGYELWEYDLSGAELRVIAGYAQEPTMIAAFNEGRSLHTDTAVAIFGEDYTEAQYGLAKNINFTAPYGGGPQPIARYLAAPGVPNEGHLIQAQQILAGWKATYPRIVRLSQTLEDSARKNGVLPTHVPGRFRHFRSPGIEVPYYTALNFLVQGGIGEFMKDVMLSWMHLHEGESAYLCLQVHDSLVMEVEPGYGPVVQQILQGIADDLNPFPLRMIFDAKEWA